MDVHTFTVFPYQPPNSDELRLLLVEPGDTDLIRVELKTVKSRTSQRFWALSYVWGARENPATILLNDQPFSITRNLYNALYRYRRHVFDGCDSDKALLWVDAICINQNDQVEKSIQVPRMSEIYGECERVLAWLGPVESDEESHVCSLSERLKHFKSPADPTSQGLSEDDRIKAFMESGRSDETAATEVESVRRALRSVGHRPWFRRIWILQEAVLAKKQPILLCGSHELGYEIFFKTWVLMLNPSEDGQLLYSFMAENPVRFKAIELVYRNMLQSRSGTTPEQEKDSVNQERQCALEMVKLLNETTELEATVAHDRLYALIGLLACDPLPSALQPDYTQSFEELCYKFTMFILEQTQDIRVLNLGTVGNFSSVPSWTPDLRSSWTARSNLTPSPGKCFNISEDERILSMPAIILGRCVSVCKPVTADPHSGVVSPAAFLQFDEAIVKVAAAIRRVTRMEVMTEWLKFHLSDIYTEERLIQNPIIVQRVMMAYVCMVHNQPLSSLGTRFGTEEQLQGAYGMVTDPIFQQSMVGCSNFVLQNGTAGQLVHVDAAAAVGDAVCVFSGLPTLFLIHRYDGKCKIVGQVSKWERTGTSPYVEQIESYRRSFEGAHFGTKADHEHAGASTFAEFKSLLQERTSEINAQDANGRTALHIAAQHGLTDEALSLLRAQADVAISDYDGQQPLYLACAEGHQMIVELLLAMGASIDSASNRNETPIAAACRKGHTRIVEMLLIKNANAAMPDNEGWTPLHWAARGSHEKIVYHLLRCHPASIDATEAKRNWTPLNAAVYRGNENVAYVLLERNANLYIQNFSGWTPLMTATRLQHLEIVGMILQHKSGWQEGYIDIHDDGGNTPLHVASMQGSLEIARQLISAGANCNATNYEKMTPLHFASGAGVAYNFPSKHNTGLPGFGSDPDSGLGEWKEAAHPKQLFPIVQLLLAKKVDPNIVDTNGMIALHYAAALGDEEIIYRPPYVMKPKDLSRRDLCASLFHSALGGAHPQVAVGALLSKQAVKNAPYWSAGGTLEVIYETTKTANAEGTVGLIFRELLQNPRIGDRFNGQLTQGFRICYVN
ncbi:hypothetical protein H9Q72_004106 [Fusarium xylarioides]|uniref:Heterokaryon incompatibility domain-containing protein n=1 Tax=Fusarium xylarioides TaxID=221167 RepID=A0A9P7HWN6_9HYPO|nr:hypothetical protein H9Q72_004106 [Fusarium xylarioides]